MVDENNVSADPMDSESMNAEEPVQPQQASQAAGAEMSQTDAAQASQGQASQNSDAGTQEEAQADQSVSQQSSEASPDDAPAADSSAAGEDAGQKAIDDFTKSLRTLPGKWYVLHTYSGYERRVKQNLEARIQNFGLEDRVYQVEVPLEEVEKHTEKGRKVINRVRIPGYVLIRMEPGDEDAFRIVRETEAVTGFVGLQSEPIPLSRKEVVSMMGPMISQRALKAAGQGEEAAKKRVQEVSFKAGDQVTVTDGPFASMPGVVSAVSPQTQKVTVTISIFDRDTPVELGFNQIEKAEDTQK
jgi:transcriptional antiterminator NusG